MEIITSGKDCIITPLSPILKKHECIRLHQVIKELALFNIGIDLSFVEDCSFEFFECISKLTNISIFNISSDIFALFNTMGLDKSVNLFVSEIDFKANKHRIIKPNLKIVQV